MELFLMQLLNGINIGAIYALIALGYTMVYGIAKLINFAHGEIIMVGSYTMFICIATFDLPVVLSIIITILACALLGVVIEKLAYKPLRNASRISLLITAIGMSYLLQSVFQLIFSANSKTFPQVINVSNVEIFNVTISGNQIVTLFVAIILMVVLDLFVRKTKTGKSMRAVSEDSGAAQLMGINVNRTISITFAIGSALAAVAGILYSSSYPLINPFMGSTIGIKAFTAAVIGGIGIIPGAVLGGFILGIIESLSKAYISSQLYDAIVFSTLILTLVFKPSGLLAKHKKEKV